MNISSHWLHEFDHLNVANYYETIEITVLGHYQVSSIKNLLKLLNFLFPDIEVQKSATRNWFFASISISQRIFLVRKCREWYTN